MSNKQKPRSTGSGIAKNMIKAAACKQTAMAGVRNGQLDCGGYFSKEEAKLLAEANRPLTSSENEGIGAGGELILNIPIEAGDLIGMELRNTVKDPTMITATAQLDRLRLADDAGALDIALDATDTIQPRNSLEKMLAHQTSAAHVLAMRMAGNAGAWLDRATPNEYTNPEKSQIANIEATRAANAASKLMQTFQQGLLALQRIRSGGQKVTVVHQHVQVAGGNVAVAGTITDGGDNNGGE